MIDAGTVVRLVYMEIAIVGGLLAERPTGEMANVQSSSPSPANADFSPL